MEMWFSEFHTPDVKHSIRVNRQLYSKQSDYQRIDIFDSMGNDIPEDSQSAQFSERQLAKLRALQKGKTFFITRVKAVGPDGIERTLAPIQVILN